jgi:hypothetical protein
MPFARYYNPFAIVTVVGNLISFVNGEGLNMRITITRSLESEPDRCDLAIEGLDPIRARLMGRIFRETSLAQIVNVQLGYDAIPTNAFTGRLESFQDVVPRGNSKWTFATAGDGAEAWDTDKLVPAKSTLAPISAQVEGAAAVLGLVLAPSARLAVAAVNPAAGGPFSASGVRTAADLLDDACRTLRCRWWIRDGMLHMSTSRITDIGLANPGPAIILAPQAPGPRLPGTPLVEPVAYGGSGILRCATFLEPAIVPGSAVSYEGGLFRVEHVVHSAETRSEAPWVSRIVGRSL